jgi:hypothetical protein
MKGGILCVLLLAMVFLISMPVVAEVDEVSNSVDIFSTEIFEIKTIEQGIIQSGEVLPIVADILSDDPSKYITELVYAGHEVDCINGYNLESLKRFDGGASPRGGKPRLNHRSANTTAA